MATWAGAEEAGGGGRKKGRCKWYNVVKGWGFITPDDKTIAEVFVHQSVIHKTGFRSLEEGEEVEFEYNVSKKGLEAIYVCGPGGSECKGSAKRPLSRKKYRKIRCYNCGDFGNHMAAKCPHGPLPKRCHSCKSTDHLIADCPEKDNSRRSGSNGSRSGDHGNDSNGNEGFSGMGQGLV
ncbi:protein lin-28 homolog [Liolophura sinensis]|uniref:protein lin-28 homolog n=1 Tax=Liolophura sinensis TaxID=3198878 RepID=UPI0031582115